MQSKERLKAILMNGNDEPSKIKLEIDSMIREKFQNITRISTFILNEDQRQLQDFKNKLCQSADTLQDLLVYLKLNSKGLGIK